MSESSVNLHDISVEIFLGGFRTFTWLIDRAEAFVATDSFAKAELLEARLHVTTAYAILRHNGVKIGKLDYLVDVARRKERPTSESGKGVPVKSTGSSKH